MNFDGMEERCLMLSVVNQIPGAQALSQTHMPQLLGMFSSLLDSTFL
jgi:hypothetical protein